MAPKKPNMLEAFQRSAREAQQADAGGQAPAPRRATPRPSRRSSGEAFGASLMKTRGPGLPSWLPAAVLILLVAMAGTYWFTRNLSRSAQAGAGERSGEAGSAELDEALDQDLRSLVEDADPRGAARPPAAGAPDHASSMPEADRRFLDKANRFTMRAVQFENDARGRELAMAVHAHMRAEGLPVVTPVELGDILVVCVGAEPILDGRLLQIQDRLQALDGPPPQNEPGAFAGAYAVNIDDYITR